MIQFHRYSSPEGDIERMAAIDARKAFWMGTDVSNPYLDNLPKTLPKNFFMRQEVVCCLGVEKVAQMYHIGLAGYKFYQGFLLEAHKVPDFNNFDGAAVYQPRSSGFFSVIENIIAAGFCAWMRGRALVIDGSYDWWDYSIPFEKLFPTAFHVMTTPPKDMKAIEFNGMRETIFNADLAMMEDFYLYKKRIYQSVYRDLASWRGLGLGKSLTAGAGVMYLRGGDKVQTETTWPTPHEHLIRSYREMARRVERRLVLSDDWELAENIVKHYGGENITDPSCKGYFHKYGQKIDPTPIVENYLTLVEAHESLSCPSANLVNAAHWTRDRPMQQTHNPVYRYALI